MAMNTFGLPSEVCERICLTSVEKFLCMHCVYMFMCVRVCTFSGFPFVRNAETSSTSSPEVVKT